MLLYLPYYLVGSWKLFLLMKMVIFNTCTIPYFLPYLFTTKVRVVELSWTSMPVAAGVAGLQTQAERKFLRETQSKHNW